MLTHSSKQTKQNKHNAIGNLLEPVLAFGPEQLLRSVMDLQKSTKTLKPMILQNADLRKNSDYLSKYCFYLQRKNSSRALKKTSGDKWSRIRVLCIGIFL